jgi:hypothetical protein
LVFPPTAVVDRSQGLSDARQDHDLVGAGISRAQFLPPPSVEYSEQALQSIHRHARASCIALSMCSLFLPRFEWKHLSSLQVRWYYNSGDELPHADLAFKAAMHKLKAYNSVTSTDIDAFHNDSMKHTVSAFLMAVLASRNDVPVVHTFLPLSML